MTRHLVYLFVGILWIGYAGTTVEAQTPHNHAFCGVGLEEGQAIKDRLLRNRRNQTALLAQFEQGRGNDSTTWVPLQFHIVTKSDGTGGETVDDILANMCKLNADYEHINVEFYLAGPINYIAQDLLYNNDFGATASFFMGMYRQTGVVNIFIGDNIANPGSNGGTLLGYYTSALDVVYAIRGAVDGTSTTLTHELGHFFGLPHTFFGWENQNYDDVMASTTGRTPTFLPSGAEVEKIVRSGGKENCQLAADGFCDTDANYLFGFFGGTYNNGCTYAAGAHDPYGILFRPDVIAAVSPNFTFRENDPAFKTIFMTETAKGTNIIYPKTLLMLTPEYSISGGTPTTMWHDTIGDTDSTDVRISGSMNVIGLGGVQLREGFVTMGNHLVDVALSSTNTNLSFLAAEARFTSLGTTYNTSFDSIRITNNGATPATAGTVITVEERMLDQGIQVASETWTFTLSNIILPGESATLTTIARNAKSTIAGVNMSIKTESVSPIITGTTETNVMSYYTDACVIGFSPEQSAAMKADIASRGFASLYPAPTDVTLTSAPSLVTPVGPAVVATHVVNFEWTAVNGATLYHLDVYETNILGQRLIGGDAHERMIAGTDIWITLKPGGRYGWKVTALNSTNFCDAALTSTQGEFRVTMTIDVKKVASAIASSSIYPNPIGASQELILEVQSTKEMDAAISIYNSVGQRVMSNQVMTLATGTNVQKLNIASLATGLYTVTISTEDGQTSHKLQVNN